ncbi:hypothetical protein [Nocardia salmonicida]|uniref:hypothetical protein n=1 Tax=Nocardia salmonicida TaxID=53431 RepID=UPI0033F9A407
MWDQLSNKGDLKSDLDIHPHAMRKNYREALYRLLSRVVAGDSPIGPRTTDPLYEGAEPERQALIEDVSKTAGKNIVGIATRAEHWSGKAESVRFVPPPPNSLFLCFEPGISLPDDKLTLVHAKLLGHRVHIVGGQPSDQVLKQISTTTGIQRKMIEWIPSERTKKPRDLDKKWLLLKPGRDIAVCVTGRIGHAQSEVARDTAKKAGVPYLPIEKAVDIASQLEQFVIRELCKDER